MLLRFFVSNFMSFAEEVEFNMFPSSLKTHKEHVYHGTKVDLLKAAALYGANGSGKSNFAKAIHFLHDIVVKGDIEENEVKCIPFKLDNTIKDLPSEFGLECKIDNKFYLYFVSIKNNEILEESLYQTFPPTEKQDLIFFRKNTNGKANIKVDSKLIKDEKEKYRYQIYEEDLQPGQSLIFKVKDKIKDATSVFKWFEQNVWILYPISKYFLTLRLCVDEEYKDFLNKLLPSLGTGMHGVDVESVPFTTFFEEGEKQRADAFKKQLKTQKMVHFFKDRKDYVARKYGKEYMVDKIKTFNADRSGKLVEFEPEEQSDGSQRILDLIPAIQKLTSDNAIFIIDEIDRSLHPSLTKALLKYFMSSSTKGQLIFTTHESNLLDFEIFRQDEIWMTEKDTSGATKMYPLSDFKPRYDLDVRKGYLAGRFGAIPFLGNLNDLSWQNGQKQSI